MKWSKKTIDRIIFLRVCEDREIEIQGDLKKIASREDIYKNLLKKFRSSDAFYNSGLFHFKNEKHQIESPDAISEQVNFSDRTLKTIIDSLYFPAPYKFDAMPADILGNVYERFLGSEIEIHGRQVKVKEKPAVKKSGGVFYTPKHIVDFIVENVIGRQLQTKTLSSIKGFSIIDPACGSGSFLIAAYQKLLDWYLQQYIKDDAKYNNKQIIKVDDDHKLTIAERKRILLAHIYGVDLDKQAVEVSKLSLLLKALEGQNKQILQLYLLEERVLPNLSDNIKCGNSLISTDIILKKAFSENEIKDINPFDYKTEFNNIFDNGGFDIIIGNPPYVFTREQGFDEREKQYFINKFKHQTYQLNTYLLFVEQSGEFLLNKNGRLGFIIPNNILTVVSAKSFRDHILREYGNIEIVNNLYKVFDGANVDTCLLLFTKTKPNNVNLSVSKEPEIYELISTIPHSDIIKQPSIQFIKNYNEIIKIIEKIEMVSQNLSEIAEIKAGLKAYEVGKGYPRQTEDMKNQRIYHSDKQSKDYIQYLEGRDVCRYRIGWSGEFLKYGYHLAAPRNNFDIFSTPRILIRQILSSLPYCINACYTEKILLNDLNSMNIIYMKEPALFILGVLNSKLISFWFDKKFQKMQRGIFPQFKVVELKTFPIVQTNRQNEIVQLVDEILSLYSQKQNDFIARAIESKNQEIDNLIYELYGITKDEQKLIG